MCLECGVLGVCASVNGVCIYRMHIGAVDFLPDEVFEQTQRERVADHGGCFQHNLG